MSVQTTYESNISAAYEGQLANLEQNNNVISKYCEGSAIDYGRAIVRGTEDEQVVLPSATGQKFMGITVYTTEGVIEPDDERTYKQYNAAGILREGLIWGYTEQSVVPGDPVFFRHTADAAPLDVIGRFRKDLDTDKADQIEGATFESTATAGELVLIRLTGQQA